MSGIISYYGGIVTDGLILDLDAGKLDSYSRFGTTWRDISGNGNNGDLTNFGSQTIWNSNNGGNIVFDGTNDYVILPKINFTNSFTSSSWVYISSAGFEPIIGNWQSLGTTDSWILTSQNNGKMYFFTSNPTNTAFVSINDSGYTLNTWYNYVGVFDNGVQKLYRNGVEVASSNTGYTSIYQNSKNLWVGHYSSYYLNGKIANTLLYNRALSSSEVLQNYNSLKGRFL